MTWVNSPEKQQFYYIWYPDRYILHAAAPWRLFLSGCGVSCVLWLKCVIWHDEPPMCNVCFLKICYFAGWISPDAQGFMVFDSLLSVTLNHLMISDVRGKHNVHQLADLLGRCLNLGSRMTWLYLIMSVICRDLPRGADPTSAGQMTQHNGIA